MNFKNEKVIYALMVLSTIFWSGAFIAAKFSAKDFPTFTLTFLRFSIATTIIFLIMLKYEDNWKIKLNDVPTFLVLGIVGMFGYHVLFFTSLKYTTAINSSLIAATNPLITAVLASLFLGDKLDIKKIGAICLSLIGVLLTITGGDFKAVAKVGFNTGDLFMLAAVSAWAVYSIISKKAAPKYSPLVLTAYSFLACTIVLIPFVIMEHPVSYIKNATATGWIAVIYMAVFPSVVGYLVQQMSFKTIGPRRTSIFTNLVPVFSIILSILILNETINPFKIFSSVLIIAGVYLTTRQKN